MPSNCVICGNSAMKDPGVSFHRLPSSPERKRQWLAAFDVSEEEWCPHWRVCSRHFPDGNPKSAPHTYQEDQFATAWALRKRTKLNQSSSRQIKRNHLNAILATRAQGALSHPFPVSTPVTVSSTPTSITASKPKSMGSVHARVPMLLPVASLASSTPGGPITVITTGESLTATQPQRQLEATGIHVHELVVMPDLDPVEESGSESSGSDNSIPGLDPAGDTTTTIVPTSHDESRLLIPMSAAEHVLRVDTATPLRAEHGTTPSEGYSAPVPMEVPRMDHFITTQRVNHTADISRIDHSSVPQAQDVSVLVKSALLARIEALENDNHQLKQKVHSPWKCPPLYTVLLSLLNPLLHSHESNTSFLQPMYIVCSIATNPVRNSQILHIIDTVSGYVYMYF